jgi:hypothetical protein
MKALLRIDKDEVIKGVVGHAHHTGLHPRTPISLAT